MGGVGQTCSSGRKVTLAVICLIIAWISFMMSCVCESESSIYMHKNDVGVMYSHSKKKINFFWLHKLHEHILPPLPTSILYMHAQVRAYDKKNKKITSFTLGIINIYCTQL